MRSVDEWIGKTDDAKVPPRVKLRIFESYGGHCYLSGRKIGPADKWEIEHIVALCNGGENRESNLAPALKDKHKEKTANDVAEKSRVSRKRSKHLGAKRKSRPMPGSRVSGWKKHLDGTVSERVPHSAASWLPPVSASRKASGAEVVWVPVFDRRFPIAEHVLCAAAARLALANGGYVSIADYAVSVGIVLGALEKLGYFSTSFETEARNLDD